jgi:drug/metabolite transporter (DMT)-like permease
VLGLLMFGELPDFWTWVGAGVIFVSSYYIVFRESRARKARAKAEAG